MQKQHYRKKQRDWIHKVANVLCRDHRPQELSWLLYYRGACESIRSTSVRRLVQITCSPAHHAFQLMMSRPRSHGLTGLFRLCSSAVSRFRVPTSMAKASFRPVKRDTAKNFSCTHTPSGVVFFQSFSTKARTSGCSNIRLRISAKQRAG